VPPKTVSDSPHKYTVLWQCAKPDEIDWINEIFGPNISDHVFDGRHEIVLDNVILAEGFVNCFDPGYYARFREKNAFLIHFCDENYEGGYEIYDNFRGVFRNYWSGVFNSMRVMHLPLGYNAGIRRPEGSEPASQRKYLWTFVGALGKSSRPEMAKALWGLEPRYLFASDRYRIGVNHEQPAGKPFTRNEYSQFLLDSAFSPCPMGNVNLECFRVYEALESGSIPIVERRLTLDYYRALLGEHPIPTVSSWVEARKLISRMAQDPGEMDILQRRCVDWWRTYKLRLIAAAGEFLADRSSDDGSQPQPVVSGLQKLPLWQVAELLRHHSLRAIGRRVQRQMERLVKQGKLRVAHRRGTLVRKKQEGVEK
jgi:hypothetical protein